jgi:uncharacterized damage-inducible protein DinB
MRILQQTALAAVAALLLSASSAVAQATPEAKKETMPAKAPQAQTGFRADFLHQLDDVEKKLVDLAQAVPAEKFAWRPAPGVRSVGEVYMHVAAANFFFPTMWGVAIPQGVDPRGLEKQGDDKAKVVAALKASLAHIRKAVEQASDADLDKSIQLFGHPSTVHQAVFTAANHMHEHLGQSIAYARMNGVVPPWSAATGAGGGQ